MDLRTPLARTLCAACLTLAATTAVAQSVGDLRAQVAAELQPYCKSGSRISVGADAITLTAGNTRAVVQLSSFTCQWEFVNHPFCGVRYCTVREYAVRGGAFKVVSERLE